MRCPGSGAGTGITSLSICAVNSLACASHPILPATGPVSAGGDRGRDFETFRTLISTRLPGSFLACDGDRRIVFSCTLQRDNLAAKIRNDLRAITDGGPVDHVYFFCEQDIPVARDEARLDSLRHRMSSRITYCHPK